MQTSNDLVSNYSLLKSIYILKYYLKQKQNINIQIQFTAFTNTSNTEKCLGNRFNEIKWFLPFSTFDTYRIFVGDFQNDADFGSDFF